MIRDKLLRHNNGLIAVRQHPVAGFPISYNPDDSRFYLHDTDEDETTIATFAGDRKGFHNVRFYARQVAKRRAANA